MNIHPSLCILFRAKARIECATCEASSHNGNSACQFLKLAHVFDFRVQRAKHPRTKQKVRVSS